jgi:hypothetical protein
MNINLHIERLILDGLPVERNQAPHIQAAVEAELTRLLTENGMASGLQTGGVLPHLNANAIQLTAGSNPAQMGTKIAQSVYSGIGNKQ